LYGIKYAAANLNILLNFTNDGNVTTKNGAEVVGTSTLQSWETWKIEILSSTSYKIYKNGALAGTYTPDYAFGAGAQNHYDFCVVNNGAEAGDYYFLWVDHNNGSILSPTREINIQPSGKYLPKANTLNTVTILGKKSGSDDPITVPIRDTTSTLYDPTLDDIGDPDSPRDLYIVDDVLNDQKSLRDKAVAMLELNTTQKYNCIVQPSDQSERPFHVGDVVRFSMHGDMYYNEFVRRVEFEWDVKTGKKNYTLETGLLSTEGMEKVQRMFSATKDRFTAMSIDRR